MGNCREGQAKVRNGEKALLGAYCRNGNSETDISKRKSLFLVILSNLFTFLRVIKFLSIIFHHLKIINSESSLDFYVKLVQYKLSVYMHICMWIIYVIYIDIIYNIHQHVYEFLFSLLTLPSSHLYLPSLSSLSHLVNRVKHQFSTSWNMRIKICAHFILYILILELKIAQFSLKLFLPPQAQVWLPVQTMQKEK